MLVICKVSIVKKIDLRTVLEAPDKINTILRNALLYLAAPRSRK